MTAQPDPQPVPDAVLTAALGGYYGHPTAITAADPDVIDGLTAGLAAGLAEARKDERAKVAEEVRAMTLPSGLTRRAMVFSIARRIEAALDQAPAAEQDGGGE